VAVEVEAIVDVEVKAEAIAVAVEEVVVTVAVAAEVVTLTSLIEVVNRDRRRGTEVNTGADSTKNRDHPVRWKGAVVRDGASVVTEKVGVVETSLENIRKNGHPVL
jgi:hypothetical protein